MSRGSPAARDGSFALAVRQVARRPMAFAAAIAVMCLACVATFADLVASDLPIVCSVHGNAYLLPNVTRPSSLAGWDNARIASARGPGTWAVFPLVRHGPLGSPDDTAPALASPSLRGGHPFGTDERGRDVFARVVHGARTSLSVALIAVVSFVGLGGVLGGIAGYFGGLVDAIVARFVETLTAFPTVVLVLVVQALVPRPTLGTLLLAIALTRWPEVTRVVRAEVLLVASQDYALAARALGASPWRVLLRHVAPNVKAPVVVATTFGLASVVLIEASLSFLRVGVPGDWASWGETLGEVRDHPGAWWLLVFPGTLVFASVAALNLVGEALRDLLDPHLRLEMLHPALRPITAGESAAPSSTAVHSVGQQP